ncbi:MAG: hypothetical protein HYZ34_05975, partial [Ignavibacteriae bacterium]|nr:hypothetical protein [Ignavibacteriota bacterium]
MKKNHLFFSSLIFSTIIFWLSNAFQVTKAQDTIQSKAKEFFSQYQNQETIEVTPKENQADVWRRYFAEHQGTLTSNTSNGLRVNTMPSHAHNDAYANAGIGVPISVWGNVQGGQLPYRFILEYGDGTVDSGDVANQKFIGGNHTYTTAGPKLTRLTVRDNTGASDTDSSLVRVFAAPTLQNNVNIAIEKGLLYLYQNQQTDGRWDYSTKQVATTGLAVLAFEANGHLPDNDNDKDIYAEFIRLGLTYLLDRVVQTSIGNQPYGNPDSDNDGKGAYFNSTSYDNGIAMQAVVSAHRNGEEANLDTIRSGVYNGQTMYDVMRDAIDQLAYSQGDNAPGRGGWRYDINVANNADNTSDHSTAQWCALALEAAEHRWGISAPQFVKDELLIWLQYIQDGTGGFGYHQQSYWNNTAKTGGGIASYVMLGYGSSATPVTNALSFLNSHWGDNFDGQNTAEHFNGNLYSMFSVAKGLRIVDNRRGVVNVGSHNWFQEYANHLLTHGTWGQKADGSWQDGGHLPGIHPLSTAFAILVLTPEIFEKPVAVIDPVSAKPPNWAFEVNGSHSYHTDPTKSIVEYLWDWNNDGTYDATGMTATNPGYAAQGTYTITLLVRDNSNPQLEDIETITVNICSGCAPPVAIAIPSERKPCYAGRVGEPMFFDGRESYEPEYPADSIVSYSWDLNGDGIFGDATTDTVTYTYNNVFNGEVGLQVTDANGLTSTQYVCISISVNDIYVESLTILPYCVAQGDSVLLIAVMRNNDTSITNYSNVLVRFYDGPPLTTGTQLGGDYFVDLNIAQSDTVTTTIQLPGVWLGTETLFVYIDPTNQIPEWDETNNVGWSEIVIGSCITLSGQKFYDVDGNGAKDVGEAGISGWLVNISGTRSAFGFTDANGNFEIRNLPPGTYTICEGERIGWIQTYPGPEGCYTATADPGDVISGNDFGNYPLGSISGRKFFDADADGVEDAGEQGIAGWNIVLSGTHPDTVLTDANGNYSFSGLPVGTYSLCEEVRPGWIQTFPLANSCYNFMLNGGENSTG